jgi:Bacterial regulatory proteins, luxR family
LNTETDEISPDRGNKVHLRAIYQKLISHNTVKVHLRAIYQKLGVTSRSQALERTIDLYLF